MSARVSSWFRLLTRIVAALSVGTGAAAAQAVAQPAARGHCSESLPALYTNVSPAVVSITAISINPYDIDHRLDRVGGSGSIIDASGLILTNSHVVFGRQVVTVTLDDGTSLPAKIVGADPVFDIALIRIPPPTKGSLPVATLGRSGELQVGEEVVAIGNPLGLEQTLTRGVVSAINRMLPGAAWSLTEPLIQTDASINPGNSGGPLVDMCGLVVGITSAIIPEAQNIGFAVPVDLVRQVMPELLEKGRVVRPWLGVQGQFVAPELKLLLRVPLVDGFLVEAIEPGSPAEQNGIRGGTFELTIEGQPVLLGGDIITHVNGVPIDDAQKLERVLEKLNVGTSLKLTVTREQKTEVFEVVLRERPVMPWDMPGGRGESSSLSPSGAAHHSGKPRMSRSGDFAIW